MAEIHYLISDASKKVDVESHVLRYWEEELELEIPRNEMGHRYYTEFHIRLFRHIRELKEKGYQLKAIKNALNKMTGLMDDEALSGEYVEDDVKMAWKDSREASLEPQEEEADRQNETGLMAVNREKMAQFQQIMNHVIGQAMEVNMERISREVGETVVDQVANQVMQEMGHLMKASEEKEEERFKQLDETIRNYQKNGKSRDEAAAAKLPFFRKKQFGKSGKKL